MRFCLLFWLFNILGVGDGEEAMNRPSISVALILINAHTCISLHALVFTICNKTHQMLSTV